MRKPFKVQQAPDLDPHLMDQVDGLVSSDLQLSPVFVQVKPDHVHQVDQTYFRQPQLRAKVAQFQNQ